MPGAQGDHHDIIGAIYDAVIEPQRWNETVDLIRRSLGFQIAMIGVQAMPSGAAVVQAYSNVPQQYVETAGKYGADILDIWGGPEVVARLPAEEPIHMMSVVAPGSWFGNRYFEEWIRPQGLVDQIVLVLERTPRLMATLGLGLHESQPPISEEQMEGVRLLAPHLRRAAIISGLLAARSEAANSFEDALTALGSGVVLVDEGLQIIYANERAEHMMRANDPITRLQGRLVMPREVVAGQLSQTVAAASGGDGASPRGGGIPVRRSDGSGMIVHVLPLRRAKSTSETRAVAAIFVSQPDVELDLPLEALSILYRLRPAETRVLDLVIRGLKSRDIAEALGVAPSTVKTHTLRIFDKLGVRTRSNILRVAREASLGVRRDA